MNNGKYHTQSFKSKQSAKTDRLFGPIISHSKSCEECGNIFEWVGRRNTKAYDEVRFCSKSCANKQGPKNRLYDYNYRTLCWKYHKKECIICKEDIIVDAHHYDNNHNNNHPTNFIPLCPTHHLYVKHRDSYYIIKECVDEYYHKFKEKWGCSSVEKSVCLARRGSQV